jgi:hypothetical protein
VGLFFLSKFTKKFVLDRNVKVGKASVAPASRRRFCAATKMQKLPAGRRRYKTLLKSIGSTPATISR